MVSIDSLIFVGLNNKVAALDRDSGEFVWEWKSPRSSMGGYTLVTLDGDRLIVSASGYIYCLDARSGGQKWENELKGYSIGIASVTSVRAPREDSAVSMSTAAAASSS